MLVCFAVFCLLFSSEARADGISIGFIAAAGLVVLVPLTAFVVFVEGIFLAIGLRIPYRRTLLPLLAANLASLAAGIPVKVFNAWMYLQILPRPLAPYFRDYPRAVLLGTSIYFLVTLIVEFLVIAGWRWKRAIPVRLARVAVFVFIANAVTYAVLAPLHYIVTRPTHDIREFTDDSKWAQSPPTLLYYVSNSGQLCSVTTDGQDRRVVVPDVVRDYQYLPDQDVFLYRNGSNDLCLYRESEGRTLLCWNTDQQFMMEQVACNPSGSIVAYLRRVGGHEPYELMLYDIESGQRANTGIITDENDYGPEIAWSDSPSTLFLKSNRKVDIISFGSNMGASRTPVTAGNSPLLRVYGRFSDSHWSGGRDWGASLSSDKVAGMEAFATPGLGSEIRVRVGETSFVLADNPGLLKLGNRGFNDVCVLHNGKELVFDDHHDIYLLDVDQRKVGWITEGSRFMMLNDRLRRNIWGADN